MARIGPCEDAGESIKKKALGANGRGAAAATEIFRSPRKGTKRAERFLRIDPGAWPHTPLLGAPALLAELVAVG